MKMKLIATSLFLMAALATSACQSTSGESDDKPEAYYGPSTENSANYTDQMRSNYRNNW